MEIFAGVMSLTRTLHHAQHSGGPSCGFLRDWFPDRVHQGHLSVQATGDETEGRAAYQSGLKIILN